MILFGRLRSVEVKVKRLRVRRLGVPAISKGNPHKHREINLLAPKGAGVGYGCRIRELGVRHQQRRILPRNRVAPAILQPHTRRETSETLPLKPATHTGLMAQPIIPIILSRAPGNISVSSPVPLRAVFSKTEQQRNIPRARTQLHGVGQLLIPWRPRRIAFLVNGSSWHADTGSQPPNTVQGLPDDTVHQECGIADPF